MCGTMSMKLSKHGKAIIPWIVAIAAFMETLDATIITTAIPKMALGFGINPINLKLALTSYLLSIALFIPISGWVADKWGTQRAFIFALVVFTVSSIACGSARNLSELVIARIFQGMGGAFMMPVGRLILLRTFDKSEMIRAMSFMAMPALLGPLVGPFLGGFITTYYSWPWIFYVNVPVGIVGIICAVAYIKNYTIQAPSRFDMMGFLLFGLSLAGIFFAIESLGSPFVPMYMIVLVICLGLLGFLLFYRHYKKTRSHVFNLRLFSKRVFSVAAIGNIWIRLGMSSTLFLLPLLLQMGYGVSPLKSGLLTCVGAIGMLFSKSINRLILKRFDFRRVLTFTSVFTGIAILSFSFISRVNTPLILFLVFINGVVTSLQYTAMNVLYYADLNQSEMSDATSISGTLQQLSMGLGITVCTLILQCFIGWGHTLALNHPVPFRLAFIVMGLISASSVLVFSKLKPTDGQAVR
jgi:EmrB/QacA subfamily drug resistance transporter